MSLLLSTLRNRYSAPATRDPYGAYVVSLCHMDGANGATVINDQVAGRSWILGGGAALSTAQKKFGTASLYLNGSSQLAYTACPTLGTQDATFECWVYPTSDARSGLYGLASTGSYTNRFILQQYVGGPPPAIQFVIEGAYGYAGTETAAGIMVPNTWQHIEGGRLGDQIYIFKDGVLLASATAGPTAIGTQSLVMGVIYAGDANRFFQGYIGGTRATIGMCRHTANFPPPGRFPEP